MALSPLDIRNKTFSTKMRGFSQEEVDDFLDQVINDYEEVIREKRELEKSLKHAEEKLTYFNELKDALNQSIIVAQDTADKLKDNASKESNIIISTAETEAKEILTKANDEAKTLVEDATVKANDRLNDSTEKARQLAAETDDLKKKTRIFHRNLTMLLESQLDIVKTDDWEELLKPFSAYVNDDHVLVKEVLADELKNEPAEANITTEQNETTTAVETTASESTTVVFPEEENQEK